MRLQPEELAQRLASKGVTEESIAEILSVEYTEEYTVERVQSLLDGTID